MGAKPLAAGQFLQFFRKSSHFNAVWMTFYMFSELLELKEAKLLRWEPGGEAPSHCAIVAIFQKKIVIWMTFCTFLEELEKAKLLR